MIFNHTDSPEIIWVLQNCLFKDVQCLLFLLFLKCYRESNDSQVLTRDLMRNISSDSQRQQQPETWEEIISLPDIRRDNSAA